MFFHDRGKVVLKHLIIAYIRSGMQLYDITIPYQSEILFINGRNLFYNTLFLYEVEKSV